MGLLVSNDRFDRGTGSWINCAQGVYLVPEMPQDHPLYCDGGRCNRRSTANTRDQAQTEPTDAAQVITATTSATSTRQLRREQSPVGFFVRSECRQCGPQLDVAPPAGKVLTSIDVDRAVLACMVDLQYTIADRFAGM
jgi:hypothetical protein